MTIEQLETRRLFASPTLDLRFGEGGLALANNVVGNVFVVHELDNGNILAAGGQDPFVARFNADGTLDTTFDKDGVISLPQNGSSVGTVKCGTIGPDGKIVLGYNFQNSLRIFRFNADGSVDQSFGTSGRAVFTVASDVFINALAVQPDGKIIVSYGVASVPYLSRLNLNGSIDNTFRGGLAGTALPLALGSLAVDSTGRIYSANDDRPTKQQPDLVPTLARFKADGTVDTSFGTNGSTPLLGTTNAGADPTSNQVTIDPIGRILVASETFFTSYGAMVTRFHEDGTRDRSFGTGDAFVGLGSHVAEPSPVVVSADGMIHGEFHLPASIFGLPTLFQLTRNGKPDNSFGVHGEASPAPGIFNPNGAIALDSDGHLLLGGITQSRFGQNTVPAVARYAVDSPDTFVNSAGHLFVSSTDGADTIALEHSGDELIVHRNGVDSSFLFASVNQLTIFDSAGGDTITVQFALNCNIATGTGNDTVLLGDGNDTIDSGDGNDRAMVGGGHHRIDLGRGNNRILAGDGNDSITAGGGNDTIQTGARGDTINAGGGDDSILTGDGFDMIYTGDGNDTVNAGNGDDLVQDLVLKADNPDSDSPPPPAPGTASGHKTYFGAAGNDTLIGSTLSDSLDGGDGADYILGSGGPDTLSGDAGADTISGAGGNDLILGADDRDHLYGGSGNDTIYGGAGGDFIYGGDADDLLFGEGGNDQIFGDNNRDTLHGGAGDDTLTSTTDALTRDLVFGDGGHDTGFVDHTDVLTSVEVVLS